MGNIDNLSELISARERQMGSPMIDDTNKEEKTDNKEIVEIMKLLFTYVQESTSSINNDIKEIKETQKKILDILNKEDKE